MEVANYTYSLANFLFVMYVVSFNHYHLIPLCITNSIAIACTWYFYIIMVDATLPLRMMEKYQWPWIVYLSGEFVFHVIPLLLAIQFLMSLQQFNLRSESQLLQHSGLYTLCINLMWSLFVHGGFEPNQVYVFIDPHQWNIIWHINAVLHIGSMYIVNHVILAISE
jgi:hypothetical protein